MLSTNPLCPAHGVPQSLRLPRSRRSLYHLHWEGCLPTHSEEAVAKARVAFRRDARGMRGRVVRDALSGYLWMSVDGCGCMLVVWISTKVRSWLVLSC